MILSELSSDSNRDALSAVSKTVQMMEKAVIAKGLGTRIKKAREARAWSQRQFASRLGLTGGAVGQWETGESSPDVVNLIRTALETGVAFEWLATERGPQMPSTEDPKPLRGLKHVPTISWVSAGRLADADSQIPVDETQKIAVDNLGRGEFFALKVQGDSMDVWSPDGSIIVVNRIDRELVAGKPYIFAVRGETTYKKWHPEPARLEPYSWNRAHQPIYIRRRSDYEVVGRVRRTILDL